MLLKYARHSLAVWSQNNAELQLRQPFRWEKIRNNKNNLSHRVWQTGSFQQQECEFTQYELQNAYYIAYTVAYIIMCKEARKP